MDEKKLKEILKHLIEPSESPFYDPKRIIESFDSQKDRTRRDDELIDDYNSLALPDLRELHERGLIATYRLAGSDKSVTGTTLKGYEYLTADRRYWKNFIAIGLRDFIVLSVGSAIGATVGVLATLWLAK